MLAEGEQKRHHGVSLLFFSAKNAECEGKVSPRKLHRRRHLHNAPTKNGQREGTGSRTCQHSTLSVNVCRLDPALQHERRLKGFSFGQS